VNADQALASADERQKRGTSGSCDGLVPGFIKEGDTIKVDTESGKYVERV